MSFFVAFYSYKGGVGRTLALANVAWSLAERGKRVVLIDMDLEAPSLHDIPELSLKGESKKGFLEYASAFRKAGKLPAIRSYVHKCRRSPGSGELWLMPAGQPGADYQQRLGDLSWRRLHPKQGTRPFVDGLRQALEEEIEPHYVLIDSRTGLSDIGGLSTHLLAHMVVLVFNLTPASIEGSVRAYRSFTSEGSRVRFVQLVASPVPPGESVAEKRIQQATELMREATLYGRNLIRIDYNPAMVLAEELAVRKPDKLPAAARYDALRDSIQRANPAEVFPIVEQALQLRSEGRLEEGVALLQSFTSAQPGDVEGCLALGNLLFEAGRYQEAGGAFASARDLAPDLALPHRRLGEALVATKRPEEAIEALKKAADLGDRSRELYLAQARAYGQRNETALEIEARSKAMLAVLRRADDLKPLISSIPELRKEFIEVLTRRPPFGGFEPEMFWDEVMGSLSVPLGGKLAILRQILNGSLRPGDLRALIQGFQEEDSRWAELLGPEVGELQRKVAQRAVDCASEAALRELLEGDRTDGILFGLLASRTPSKEDRSELLQQALRIVPDNPALLFGLGTTIFELANLAEGQQRKQLLLDACLKYQEALTHKPDMHDALYNWGVALADLAELAEGQERKQLLLDACLKFQQALTHKPDKHEALYNWGVALAKLAELAEGQERKQLLLDACLKYQQALTHKPDKHEALYNWGVTLEKLAELAEGQERKQLLLDACLKYQQALTHKPDKHEALYNWGGALVNLAKLAEGQDRKQLLLDACLKYQQALTHKPDMHQALYNWSASLGALARSAAGEEQITLWHQAADRAREANDIQPGAGDYNLACALSQLQSFDEASGLLRANLESNPRMRSHALQDPDLAPLWEARPELRREIEAQLAQDAPAR